MSKFRSEGEEQQLKRTGRWSVFPLTRAIPEHYFTWNRGYLRTKAFMKSKTLMKICGPGAQHTRLQVDIDTMYLSDRFTFTLFACHELMLVQRSFQNHYNEIKSMLCYYVCKSGILIQLISATWNTKEHRPDFVDKLKFYSQQHLGWLSSVLKTRLWSWLAITS